MPRSGRTLWLLWAIFFAAIALEVALPYVAPRRPLWHPAQTAVAGFVLALLSLTIGIGSFALREALAMREVRAGALDPRSPAGFARVCRMLLVLWALCLLIGLAGSLLGYAAGSPTVVLPYALAAAGLLLIHAPRRRLFTSGALEG